MAKEIEGKLKLQVPAGQANPSPPVGPALGQRGINIMDFCKVFNEKSKGEQPGVMLPVVVTYNTDKSFSIEIKLPPASFFIKEALFNTIRFETIIFVFNVNVNFIHPYLLHLI